MPRSSLRSRTRIVCRSSGRQSLPQTVRSSAAFSSVLTSLLSAVSWGYGVTGYGDTGVVVTSITGGQQYQPQGNGNFLLCLSAAGGDGTNDAPWLYYNLNAYGVNSPWACYDAVGWLSF
jgi:hypothetical protein